MRTQVRVRYRPITCVGITCIALSTSALVGGCSGPSKSTSNNGTFADLRACPETLVRSDRHVTQVDFSAKKLPAVVRLHIKQALRIKVSGNPDMPTPPINVVGSPKILCKASDAVVNNDHVMVLVGVRAGAVFVNDARHVTPPATATYREVPVQVTGR